MAKKTKKRSKTKKKIKVKKKIKNKSLNKKVNELGDNQELIIKTKAEWTNKALVNKSDWCVSQTDTSGNILVERMNIRALRETNPIKTIISATEGAMN